VSTATDEHVDLGVDLDAEVPCSVESCEEVAQWRLVIIPCRHSWPMCEAHARRGVRDLNFFGMDTSTLTMHPGCSKPIDGATMEPL
jgi:hypothetical protein